MMHMARWSFLLAVLLGGSGIACGSSTNAPGAGEGGGGGNGGNGDGEICGSAVCAEGERCFDVCGAEPQCSFGNITCGEHDFGACGCDGVAYETLCDLDAAAVAEGEPGSCEPPAGFFACEALLCRIGDHVCQAGSSPYCYPNGGCIDCSCVDDGDFCSGGGSCVDVPDGGVVVTCD